MPFPVQYLKAMNTIHTAPPSKAMQPRSQRQDGKATKANLLEVAGRVFAEHGYVAASGKEVCELAGTNLAAINYYFGSKDGLYEAVLVEAHRRVIDQHQLTDLLGTQCDSRAQLVAVLSNLVIQTMQGTVSWAIRVLVRELVSPSPLAPALFRRAIKPHSKLLRRLVGQVLGLPSNHVAVQRGLSFAFAPCLTWVVAPAEFRKSVLPALNRDVAGLADDLARFTLAGLDALAKEHGRSSAIETANR
ncbi:HTH-type transcriptional dual regulator CecR [Methylophilaceae bacterium]|nr:HTH-type transcriptional dual regulator CecR [Methylophilaceae bacterium]